MKLIAIPASVLVIGLALIAWQFDTPRMANDTWQASVPYLDSAAYFSEYERNVTTGARWFDLGLGLTSFGVSLVVLVVALRLWNADRLRALRTPERRWPLFITANIVWSYYILATTLFLGLQWSRNEYPPWADTIVIALIGLSAYALMGGVLVNLGLALCVYGAKLPVSLWAKPRTVRSWALNLCIAIALLMCMWAGLDTLLLGDPYTPPAVVAVSYLLLIGRACACAA